MLLHFCLLLFRFATRYAGEIGILSTYYARINAFEHKIIENLGKRAAQQKYVREIRREKKWELQDYLTSFLSLSFSISIFGSVPSPFSVSVFLYFIYFLCSFFLSKFLRCTMMMILIWFLLPNNFILQSILMPTAKTSSWINFSGIVLKLSKFQVKCCSWRLWWRLVWP